MNILFLTDLFLPHAGGARVYYHNIYKHLVAGSDDSVTILTTRIPGWQEFDNGQSSASLRIVRKGHPMPNWKYYQLPRVIHPLAQGVLKARSSKADLIHFGDLCPPGVVSVCLKRLLGLPYLAYCHGDENAQIDGRRFQPIVRDHIYGGAAAVVAANEFARQGLLRIGIPDERIHKITPGVDLERFRPMSPDPELFARLSLAGKTVLLTAARLVPKKGHATALHAVARVHAETGNIRYLIAGDGPERNRLETLTRELGLSEVVTFLGDVPNAQLPAYYNLCDIFVMANRQASDGDIETFGMVFIEANAAGKPVVAGRSGGAAEAVVEGATGFLVVPEDAEELSARLKMLVLDKVLRERIGAAGLQRARTDFQWKTRAERLKHISAEILASGIKSATSTGR